MVFYYVQFNSTIDYKRIKYRKCDENFKFLQIKKKKCNEQNYTVFKKKMNLRYFIILNK